MVSNGSIRFDLNTVADYFRPATKMASFHPGDRLCIIRGRYKGKYATYLSKYGILMCSVKIDGDNVAHRNLRLTSIAPALENNTNDKEDVHGASSWTVDEDTQTEEEASIKRRIILCELRSQVATMKAQVEALEKKLTELSF